jgi:hypothetical protein
MAWRYIAPAGTTLDDCKRSDYFKNLVRECGQSRYAGRPAWNRIEIICEDGTWEAALRVLSAGDGLVHTRVIFEWHAPKVPGRKPALPDGYTVEHIPNNGWRALDNHGAVISDRLPIEEDAVRAASAHSKKAAA